MSLDALKVFINEYEEELDLASIEVWTYDMVFDEITASLQTYFKDDSIEVSREDFTEKQLDNIKELLEDYYANLTSPFCFLLMKQYGVINDDYIRDIKLKRLLNTENPDERE